MLPRQKNRLAERILSESDVTHLLARDSRNLQFVPLGGRTLKGFTEPVPLFEMRWLEDTVGRRLTPLAGPLPEHPRPRGRPTIH